jgi:YesN/AraC family two-component response regulator
MANTHTGRIDVMVTDVVMPHMSGAELAAEMSRRQPGIRVLFVSGYAEKTVLQHGVLDLSSSFLQKPFSLRDLGAKLRSVLEAPGPPAPV